MNANTIQPPLAVMTQCCACPRMALGTGLDGKPYCHACRDWKADRMVRIERQRIAMTLTEVKV